MPMLFMISISLRNTEQTPGHAGRGKMRCEERAPHAAHRPTSHASPRAP